MNEQGVTSNKTGRAIVCLGGGALLLAMAIDALAVVGRWIGVPLIGSIEMVKATVCLSACAAMIVATLVKRHAHVHFLTDRIPKRFAGLFDGFSGVASACFFAAVAAGSGWLLIDSWGAFEESEILHIPYVPLRTLASATALGVSVLFLLGPMLGRRK